MKKLIYTLSLFLLIGMLATLPAMIVEFTKNGSNENVQHARRTGQMTQTGQQNDTRYSVVTASYAAYT